MSHGDRGAVYLKHPEQLNLPAGVTAAILPMPGQIGSILKYVSGGSLSIIGASSAFGTTYGVSCIYTLGTGEIMNIAESGTIFLMASGSTCVAQLLRLRSSLDSNLV